MLFAALMATLLLLSAFAAPVGAQDGGVEDNPVVSENSSILLTLEPTSDGHAAGLAADIVASADLEDFVVDIYVDDVLESSEQNPDSIDVTFEPTTDVRNVQISVRDFGEAFTCQVDGGSVQLQNLVIAREAVAGDELTLLQESAWTVSADSPAEVANVAAIGTFASTAADFAIAEESGAAVQVGGDAFFDTSEQLWQELSGEPRILPGSSERLVVNTTNELDTSGGSVFISESEFGGRVGSVRLEVDVLVTPQADAQSGFALRVNGEIVETGQVDENGQASFTVIVEEDSWPRDATVTLDLSLVESDTPCNDERPFSGQIEVRAVPVGTPQATLTVADFPAVLLEGAPALFAGEGVSNYDVAAVSSALQATSAERLIFADAESADMANVVVERGSVASVAVVDNALVVTLTDAAVDLFQEERFWVFGDDSASQSVVEVAPEALAFVDIEEGPIANATSDLSLYRIVPFALLVLLVIAVLSLLWKNSKAPAES